MEQYYERIERGGNTTALVFVHGVLGHYRETWGEFPNLVMQDSPLNHCDVICWGYPSSMQAPKLKWLPFFWYRMPDLMSVAEALSSDLNSPAIGGSYKDLLLVGHSMGGLVIMRMIISALTKTTEHTPLLDRIRHVLLYATPSDGVQLPAVLKVHMQAKSIDCRSDFITQLRNEWISRVHVARFEDPPQTGKRHIAVTAVMGLEDNAVPPQSVTSHYTDVHTVPGNHSGVCKPSSREHTSFQILKGVVLKSIKPGPASTTNHEGIPGAQPSPPSESSPETPPVTDVTPKKEGKWTAGWDAVDKGHFETAYELFKEHWSESGEDASGIENLAFIIYHLYMRKGWAQGFNRLKQLATDHPTAHAPFGWLARAYRYSEQWDLVIENLKKALELSVGSERLKYTVQLASCLISAGKGEDALSELRTGLSLAQDPPDKAQIYKAFGDTLLKVRKSNPLLGIACYEKALALQQSDTSLRFDLAYKHKDVITASAAFYHYRKLLLYEKSEYALNNVGVRAQELELPLTSIDYYTEAADKNNTLAMANMARKLIDSGFEKMGKELLERARQQSEVHGNVDIHLGEIKRARTRENDKIEELEEKVENIVRWHCREGDAIVQPQIDPDSLTGSYQEADGTTLTVTCRPDGIVLGSRQSPDEVLSLNGRVEGRLLRFSWKTNPTASPAALLAPTSLLATLGKSSQPSSGEGVLIVEENGSVLSGYRVKNGAPLEPTPWRLTRAPEAQ